MRAYTIHQASHYIDHEPEHHSNPVCLARRHDPPSGRCPCLWFLAGLARATQGLKPYSAFQRTEKGDSNGKCCTLTGDHPRLLRVSSGSFSDRAEYAIIYANPADFLPSAYQRYHPRTGLRSARASGATQVSVLPSYTADEPKCREAHRAPGLPQSGSRVCLFASNERSR